MRCWRAESGGQWNFFNTTIFIIMLWHAHGRHDTATPKGQNQEIDPQISKGHHGFAMRHQ